MCHFSVRCYAKKKKCVSRFDLKVKSGRCFEATVVLDV